MTCKTALALFLLGSLCTAGCGGGSGGGGGGTQPPAKTTPTISAWPTASAITYGQTLASSTLTGGSASVSGTFAWTTPSTAPSAGTPSESMTFAPADTIDYNAVAGSVAVTVNKVAPTVSVWPTAGAIASGQALSASTLTGGTASVPGTFAWVSPTTVPAVGTDSENVAFTPTDTADYQVVIGSIAVVVNPTTPQVTAFTPRYAVADDTIAVVNHAITCAGCVQGDLIHDATGIFPGDLTWPSSSATQTFFDLWQQGNFQPTWDTVEIQHPSGAYGNQWSFAFLGSASQSTFAISPTTGRLFQVQQANGQIYWQDTNGATGLFYPSNVNDSSPTLAAVDDTTGNVVSADTGTSTSVPQIAVNGQAGWTSPVCRLAPTGISFISSIAARGGYMVGAAPLDNKIFVAKMDCSGYKTISVAGQPWSVAMTNNGTETDAYVLFRDAWAADGHPGVVKFVAPAMTVAGSVELANVPSVSSIRATAPQEGVYQLVAFTNTPVVAVLFMSGSTDGKVLLVSTNTSGANVMKVTQTTPVTELPFALATQETGSASTLWVAYIKAAGGDNVTYAGTVNLATGNYASDIGTFPAGILAGGFAASATQVYGAQGSTIAPLQQ